MIRFLLCLAVGWVVVDMFGIGSCLDQVTGGGILGSLVSTAAVGAASWSAVTTGWPIRLLSRMAGLRLPAAAGGAGEDGFAEMVARAASTGIAFDGDRIAVVSRGVTGEAAEAMRSARKEEERFIACGQAAVAVVGGSMLAVDGARGFMVDGTALEAALILSDGAFVRLPATPLDRADSKSLASAIAKAVADGTVSAAGEALAIGDDALVVAFGPSQTTSTAAETDGEGDRDEPDYEAAFGPAAEATESRAAAS